MAEWFSRRRFLAVLGGMAASVPGLARAGSEKGPSGHGSMGKMEKPGESGREHGSGEHGRDKHGGMDHSAMEPRHAWRDESRPLSDPPPTMGRQMGRVYTLNVPPLGYELDGRVKVFRLVAQPVRRMFSEGIDRQTEVVEEMNRFSGGMSHSMPRAAKLWGYNGQMPGPTIECVQGDRIRVILKNELPEPTSIHWHGLEVPNSMDGAGGTTEPVTMPGQERVYEFTLNQVGTYMYHTGFNMMKQDGLGLGGMVVIHPKRPEYRIDRDVAIMLQAFALEPGNEFPNLTTMDFDWFTFNGKVAPDIEVVRARQGERIRLRFANLAMSSHPIHVHGYVWKVVGTEGGPIPKNAQWPGSTVNVPPGTTRDVEFVAHNPGVWRLHCHKLHHTMNAHADIPLGVMGHGGMFTLLEVRPGQEES